MGPVSRPYAALLAILLVSCRAGFALSAPGESAGAGDLAGLRRQLHASSETERIYAAATLLERGSPEALKALNDLLRGANYHAVRLSILDAIDMRRDARFVDALLHLLGDRESKVRERAAAVLGAFGNHGVVGRLETFLLDPRTGEVAQLTGIEALVRTEQKDAVGVLVRLLSSDYKSVQGEALKVLRDITRVDLGAAPGAWATWWRRNRHKTPFQWSAHRADELLRQIRAIEQALAKARRTAIEMTLRYEATIGDPKQRAEFLKGLLTNDYPDLRAHAAEALPGIKEAEGVLDALRGTLADTEPRVVAAAATGLGTLGDAKAATDLVPLLERDEALIRAAAARSLGVLKAETAVKHLIPLLDDADDAVRQAATETLGRLNAPDAFAGLAARLTDANPQIRTAAITAVARSGDARAAAPLADVLRTDKDPRVRFFAARALVGFTGKAVDEALVKALGDSDPGVRQAAAAGLGKRSDPALVDPLIGRALGDESDTVKREARSSVLALLEAARSLALLDRVSGQLIGRKADALAIDVLQIAEKLAPDAKPDEAALMTALRRRLADAFVRAENWARAATVYRVLLADGDRTAEAPLIVALRNQKAYAAAARVHLQGLTAETPAADRTARLTAVIDLAAEALAADDPLVAIAVLRRLREAVKTPLNEGLEGRVVKVAADASAAFDRKVKAASPQVSPLLKRAVGPDAEAAGAAAADLTKLGWPAVPALLDALADAQAATRSAAVAALRSITGSKHDFSPEADETARKAAVERWRAWCTDQRTVPAPGG